MTQLFSCLRRLGFKEGEFLVSTFFAHFDPFSNKLTPASLPIPPMNTDLLLRDHLVKLLSWRSAHVSFDDAINGIPPEMHGQQHQDLPFSLWQLLEHLRLAQYDILDFCRNPDYTEGVWPDDYWPDAPAPPSPEAWNTSLARFRENLQAMQDLVADTGTDLYAPIPHGDGQTILREALLLADHNAYHVGQLVAVRRLLGLWPPLSNDS